MLEYGLLRSEKKQRKIAAINSLKRQLHFSPIFFFFFVYCFFQNCTFFFHQHFPYILSYFLSICFLCFPLIYHRSNFFYQKKNFSVFLEFFKISVDIFFHLYFPFIYFININLSFTIYILLSLFKNCIFFSFLNFSQFLLLT